MRRAGGQYQWGRTLRLCCADGVASVWTERQEALACQGCEQLGARGVAQLQNC